MELIYNEFQKYWYWKLDKIVISPQFDQQDSALDWHRAICGLFEKQRPQNKSLPKLLTKF